MSELLRQNSELLVRVDEELRRIYERSMWGRMHRLMRNARMREAERQVRDYGYRADQRGFLAEVLGAVVGIGMESYWGLAIF